MSEFSTRAMLGPAVEGRWLRLEAEASAREGALEAAADRYWRAHHAAPDDEGVLTALVWGWILAVKIFDFGLVKLLGTGDSDESQATTISETTQPVVPEKKAGKKPPAKTSPSKRTVRSPYEPCLNTCVFRPTLGIQEV